MEVVYFFYESGTVRIPFFDYDQRLFRMLVSVGGGVWNNTCKEFVFRRNEDMMRFSKIASYIPSFKGGNPKNLCYGKKSQTPPAVDAGVFIRSAGQRGSHPQKGAYRSVP